MLLFVIRQQTNIVSLFAAALVWWSLTLNSQAASGDLEIGQPISPRMPNSPGRGDIISDTPSVWANYVSPSQTKWPSEPGIPYNPWYLGREQLCMHASGPWDPFGIVVDYKLSDFNEIAAWVLKERVEFRDIGIRSEGIRIASIRPLNSKDDKSSKPPRLVKRISSKAFFMNVREFPGNSVPYFAPSEGRDAELLAFLHRTGVHVSKFESSLRHPDFGRLHWLYYQAPIAVDELSFWIAASQDQPFVDDVTFWPAPFLPSKIAVRCYSNKDKRQLINALHKYGYFVQGGASFPLGVRMDLYRITVPETGEAVAIRRMRALGLDALYAIIPGAADRTTQLGKQYSQAELGLEGSKAFATLDSSLKKVLQTRFGASAVTSIGGGFFRVDNVYRGPKFMTWLDKSGWERVKCLASVTVRGKTCFIRVQFDVEGTSKGDSATVQPLPSLFKKGPDSDALEVKEAERIANEVVVAISGG